MEQTPVTIKTPELLVGDLKKMILADLYRNEGESEGKNFTEEQIDKFTKAWKHLNYTQQSLIKDVYPAAYKQIARLALIETFM